MSGVGLTVELVGVAANRVHYDALSRLLFCNDPNGLDAYDGESGKLLGSWPGALFKLAWAPPASVHELRLVCRPDGAPAVETEQEL